MGEKSARAQTVDQRGLLLNCLIKFLNPLKGDKKHDPKWWIVYKQEIKLAFRTAISFIKLLLL